MTREEAITTLKEMHDSFDRIHENSDGEIGYEQMTALDMATEALHREEAEEKGYCHRIKPKSVEVVVRCKDCIHWKADNEVFELGFCCVFPQKWVAETFFCADGERREE